MLLHLIESIRKKPKVVRKQIAFVVTVAFTAIVAGVWVLSLPAQLTSLPSDALTAVPTENQVASVPFSTIWHQLKVQVADLAHIGTLPMSESDTAVVIEAEPPAVTISSQSVQLESGSTITFGSSTSNTAAPVILLGTVSSTATTSPLRD